jgi:hypothetical protein
MYLTAQGLSPQGGWQKAESEDETAGGINLKMVEKSNQAGLVDGRSGSETEQEMGNSFGARS